MANRCEICGKGTITGDIVPRKGQAKKKGGVGQHIGVRTKRIFKPNLIEVKAEMANGSVHTVTVCTKCLKAGKVVKAV